MVSRPMEGVRVVEVAQYTFVPSAGAILAEWGAEVIKVEHAVAGDAQRGLTNLGAVSAVGPFAPIIEHPNHCKRSIGLALELPEAREVLYDLVRQADVFLTNFLPEARARLEIDVEHIRAVNPNVIYVRGSALGNRGAERLKGGYDSITYWCRGGSAQGVTPPNVDAMLGMPAPAYGDSIGGMTIAGGISAALFARERTGEPSVIDVNLLGVGAWANALSIDSSMLNGQPWSAAEIGGSYGAPTNPLAGIYKTGDGRWLAFTMLQVSRYWDDFCRHIGREDLLEDERFDTPEKVVKNAPSASEIIAHELASRPFDEWIERFKTLEGPWAPVLNSLEVGHDDQLRANGFVGQVVDVDGVGRELIAAPVQFDEVPAELRRAPQFAEHTDEILREVGRSEEQILDLKIAGAAT
jgi:crotonobetainyl-CoA:carnitine CoA-transferase CaiB-like acyl-CoA transferase